MPLTHEHKEFIRQAIVGLEEAATNMESIQTELQETFDELTEATQTEDHGNNLVAVMETLEDCHGQIHSVVAALYELNPQPKPGKRTK